MSGYYEDPADDIHGQLEVQTGRRAPFSQVADWVLLSGISRTAKLLYWVLSAHLNTESGSRKAWPSQDALAELLGYSDGRKIRPFLRELVEIGAVRIPKPEDPDQNPADHYYYVNGLRRQRTIFIVYQMPPTPDDNGPDGDGPDGGESAPRPQTMKEFYAIRNARRDAERRARDAAEAVARRAEIVAAETAGAERGGSAETPGGRNEPPGKSEPESGAPGGRNGHAPGGPVGPPNYTKKNQTKKNQTNLGGHPAAPPDPRRNKPAGQDAFLVTDQGDFSRNQTTARGEKPAPTGDFSESGKTKQDDDSTSGKRPTVGKIIRRSGTPTGYAAARAAAAACTVCDDAGLTPDGSPCVHDALRPAPDPTPAHYQAGVG